MDHTNSPGRDVSSTKLSFIFVDILVLTVSNTRRCILLLPNQAIISTIQHNINRNQIYIETFFLANIVVCMEHIIIYYTVFILTHPLYFESPLMVLLSRRGHWEPLASKKGFLCFPPC